MIANITATPAPMPPIIAPDDEEPFLVGVSLESDEVPLPELLLPEPLVDDQ
jgi:hypothetical protein